jgi:hypothetical protein
LALALVLVLILYGLITGLPPSSIVTPPYWDQSLYSGFLTHIMQILCAVPVVACAFSYTLLTALRPRSKNTSFLLASTLVTGGFLINEIFRIHIYLASVLGIPKAVTILGYCIVVLLYGLTFRQQWHSTPYELLVASGILFVIAFAMDSQLFGRSSALLEGIPKFFSFLNLALFFWLVCRQKTLQAFQHY